MTKVPSKKDKKEEIIKYLSIPRRTNNENDVVRNHGTKTMKESETKRNGARKNAG